MNEKERMDRGKGTGEDGRKKESRNGRWREGRGRKLKRNEVKR